MITGDWKSGMSQCQKRLFCAASPHGGLIRFADELLGSARSEW